MRKATAAMVSLLLASLVAPCLVWAATPQADPSSQVPGLAPPPRTVQEPAHHRLVGIVLPPRNYSPRDHITVPDPWDQPMMLTFNTFLNPQMFGPVVLTVDQDASGRIPEATQFLGTARTINGRTIIVWTRMTLPNGKVAWTAANAKGASVR